MTDLYLCVMVALIFMILYPVVSVSQIVHCLSLSVPNRWGVRKSIKLGSGLEIYFPQSDPQSTKLMGMFFLLFTRKTRDEVVNFISSTITCTLRPAEKLSLSLCSIFEKVTKVNT